MSTKLNNTLIIIFLINFLSEIKAQRVVDSLFRDEFSIELDANYNRHLLFTQSTKQLGYGFSINISKFIGRFKIGIGVNQTTKVLNTEDYWWPYKADSREFLLKYINIPVSLGIQIAEGKCLSTGITMALITSINTKYEITTFYPDGTRLKENVFQKGLVDSNVFLLFGNNYAICAKKTKGDKNKMFLNLLPFVALKIKEPKYHPRYNYQNIPGDRIIFGFKLGIEYIIKNI